jgi:hypothetical protein
MLQRLKRHRPLVTTIALGASLAMTTGAAAQRQFTRECALRDLTAITLIEDHGDARSVPAERLFTAVLTMLDARSACYEGRVSEALALYKSILDITPVASNRRERP